MLASRRAGLAGLSLIAIAVVPSACKADRDAPSENRLRIDGTAASGSPVVVAVDTLTGEISVVSSTDLPRFQAVTPLQ